MAMDSSECNGSAEAPKVELEGKAVVEFGSEKDLAKSDGIASTEREMNDQDEIGGPFVIINGDSDNSSEKFLQLDEKVDPETTSEDEASAVSPINSGNGIGMKEVEGEAELENGSVPVKGNPPLENSLTVASNCDEKLEEKSKEGAENGELSDNGVSEEPLAEEDGHEKGQECELSLAGKLESEKDVNLGMSQFETVNGEDNGSELGFEPVEKVEEEHPVSSSIEGADEEKGRMHELKTSDKPNQHAGLDITMTVEEQIPQEFDTEASLVPSVQVMYEESGMLSGSPGTETKAEMPLNESLHTTLDLAVEAESEKNNEMQEVFIPSEEEVVRTKEQVAADSLQENKEVGMLKTESKEQSLLDSADGVECELRHKVQLEESGTSQEDEQQEESEGVSDSMQSNEKSDSPETELNNQSVMESTVEVESGSKHEEQCEVSTLFQEEEMHEKTEEVPVPSESEKEIMKVPETELKEMSLPDFETDCTEGHGTVSETKVEEQQDTVTTVSDGKENGVSAISPSHILLEEKQAPYSSSPDQAKLAETEMDQQSNPREAKCEFETDDKEEPSESTYQVEEMQNSKRADATFDGPAVSTSHEIEVDSSLVNGNELVASSSDVLPDSGNKSTIEVEESDRSLTEFEDGQPKTEEEPASVSSNDPSARAIALEDLVQIGEFKISIGENGPAILQQELQEGVETSEAATPEVPGTSTCNGEKAEVQPLKKQPIYIVKVPRYSDEVQWEKIQRAQIQLDELTRTRDAIRNLMQERRIACSESWDEVAKAKEEERAARTVFSAKRQEINAAQSVINKLNKANSIDDMDDLIEMKEKSLQHETMTLKQEKMLIQEIKELKSQRKKLIDNMGSAAEIDEAFDQKDCVFDKLKTLKTELEVLGKTLTKAEAKTRAAQKAYDEIDLTFCTLQDEYKSANDVRQKAYFNWRNLRSQLAVKNKHFFNYRDDQKRAASFLGHNPPEKEGLRLYCNRQVEKTMELWNSDAEFRKQYILSNKNSTLRRLRTLDGRSLGPDEVPPVIPTTSTAYRRTNTPLVLATKEIRLEKSAQISTSSSSSSIQSNEFPELPHRKPNVTHNSSRSSKGTSKEKVTDQPVVMDIVAAKIDSAKMEEKQEEDEIERRKREEEAERARREEDIKRKAKAEAEEKERRREEQKAKAKEAEERKKRKAEKAQERAEFKARKEAEIRDKKRAKKDKKKVAGGESDSGDATNGTSAESSTTSEIAQIRDVPLAAPTTATRRPTRPQVVSKQLKRVEPVPVALRNRGRRKMRSWIIGIVTAIAALLTVFFIGNYVNFSDISSLVWL